MPPSFIRLVANTVIGLNIALLFLFILAPSIDRLVAFVMLVVSIIGWHFVDRYASDKEP